MSAADFAVFGTTVRTLDPDLPVASAIAWPEGTVGAVGDDARVRGSCYGATELLDRQGATLTPGITNSH